MKEDNKKIVIVSDVDGVLTDGHFYYSSYGKILKQFGRNDADALKIFKKICLQYNIDGEVHFCTSDKNGFKITRRRLNDMGFEADVVSVADRPQWIKENFIDKGFTVYYIGDSFVDIASNYTDLVRKNLEPEVCVLLSQIDTIYEAKYNTLSSTRGDKSRMSPIRDGIPLKYQI